MSIQFIPDGYCGSYCAACPEYRTAEKSDPREIASEDAACYGCKSEQVKHGWCEICVLKRCAREKGIEFCYECAEYPCQQLEAFQTDKDYPYHTEVYEYMETIKNKGREAWLREMKERWGCPCCRAALVWWDTVCPNCGTRVNGYNRPEKKE